MNKYVQYILIITIVLSLLLLYISNFLYELAQDIDKEVHRTKLKFIDHGKYSEIVSVQYMPEFVEEIEETCTKIINYSKLFCNLQHCTFLLSSIFVITYIFNLTPNKIDLSSTKRANSR